MSGLEHNRDASNLATTIHGPVRVTSSVAGDESSLQSSWCQLTEAPIVPGVIEVGLTLNRAYLVIDAA